MLVDREVIAYAVALADATRRPERYGLEDVAAFIEFGASPRGPIGLVQAARALRCCAAAATSRWRTCATSRPTCCATGSCCPTTR